MSVQCHARLRFACAMCSRAVFADGDTRFFRGLGLCLPAGEARDAVSGAPENHLVFELE